MPPKKPSSIADAQHPSYRHFKVTDNELETLIARFCNDLTARAKEGKGDPITGRENEVDEILTILLHRGRSNVVLLGGAGTGKTAVFVATAQRIAANRDVPKLLKDARVLELDFALVGAGTESRGEFEGRLVPLLKGVGERNETKEYPQIVLCIDELHTIMRTCHASSASGVADLLKPYLTVGNLQVIGATTEVEYDEHVRRDPAMDRRFQKIVLKQPNAEETVNILKNIRKGYEKHFDIIIPDEICEQIVKLASKYIRNRNNPDKSIMVMDGACARFCKDGAPNARLGGTLTLEYIKKSVGAEINVAPEVIE
ncbi:MAG: AAA family ATPase [Bdellovibrionales bacterium]